MRMAYLRRAREMKTELAAAGVYGPEMEHDACGVGFVAARDGQPNRAVVDSAIEALQAIWHRGAVDADWHDWGWGWNSYRNPA